MKTITLIKEILQIASAIQFDGSNFQEVLEFCGERAELILLLIFGTLTVSINLPQNYLDWTSQVIEKGDWIVMEKHDGKRYYTVYHNGTSSLLQDGWKIIENEQEQK